VRSWELTGPEVSIGRDPSCDASVRDFRISRRHAKLVVNAGRVRLIDTQSKGGTRLNGLATLDAELSDLVLEATPKAP
jgi:pSer/pThr/pTyr-binding forkhead associated (FHA) protein